MTTNAITFLPRLKKFKHLILNLRRGNCDLTKTGRRFRNSEFVQNVNVLKCP